MGLRVKNWSRFQHFRDRNPPWIKLYKTLVDDPDWHELDPADAKALVMIWLIASESGGTLPEPKRLAFRLRVTASDVKSMLSRLSHWLENHDINVISPRYHNDAPETETESERETEKETKAEEEGGSSATIEDRISNAGKPELAKIAHGCRQEFATCPLAGFENATRIGSTPAVRDATTAFLRVVSNMIEPPEAPAIYFEGFVRKSAERLGTSDGQSSTDIETEARRKRLREAGLWR